MVSKPARTRGDQKSERIDRVLRIGRVPRFDKHVAETKQYTASVVRFRGNRFSLSDAETERMLRVSMEAVQDEW